MRHENHLGIADDARARGARAAVRVALLALLPVLSVLGVSLVASETRAEVRAVEHPSHGWSVEIATGPGGETWTPVPSHAFGPHVLNPGGEIAGDGAPSVGVRPVTGLPEALWAVATPRGHDLAFARHDGVSWNTPVLVMRDMLSSDVRPLLAYDDFGRSLIAWKKIGNEDDMIVAGLSVEGRLWGQRPIEGPGMRPVAMESDGQGFYLASVHQAGGRLRFKHVGFPFPNGGPALPFPDDSLLVTPVLDEPVGADEPPPSGSMEPPSLPSNAPATLAATTLELHRDDDIVWSDWVTPRSTVAWVAFRDAVVLDRGEEPYNGPNQVSGARDRIRRMVGDL